MLSAHAFNLHLVGNILKASLKLFAALHQIFYVKDGGKVDFEHVEKFLLVLGQFCLRQ